MGGKFYGSKVELIKLLVNYFGVLVMDKITNASFTETPEGYSESLKQESYQAKPLLAAPNVSLTSYAANQRMLIDF
ncbi:hypothetical protein [Kordia sp.]|uniref:hypothetical protein n=1 Tax=Kordia sp. TaxID=1965332 RepID=UPI0025C6A345|nr:hypothetical protein [Kordia sp.]MCH2195635.1 hypothetical protein [Kordia sp.]